MPKSIMNQVNRKMVKPAVKQAIRPRFSNLRSMFRSQQRPMAQPTQPQIPQQDINSLQQIQQSAMNQFQQDQRKAMVDTGRNPLDIKSPLIDATQEKQTEAEQASQEMAQSRIQEIKNLQSAAQEISPNQQKLMDQNRLIQQSNQQPNPVDSMDKVVEENKQKLRNKTFGASGF